MRGPFPDNGTPVARRGRKATGQDTRLKAGLPKEGSPKLLGNRVVLRDMEGHPVFRRLLARQLHLPSSYSGGRGAGSGG